MTVTYMSRRSPSGSLRPQAREEDTTNLCWARPKLTTRQVRSGARTEACWILGAFPSMFQNEAGDPYHFKLAKPDLVTWGPHVLRSRGRRAQAHMTFMHWWTNMCQRIKALGAKKWFVKDNPKATGYTAEDIKKMSVPMLSKKMVGYTQNIPGTRASKTRLRKIILAMVRQIEIETHRGPHYLGDVPCLFGTLTSQRYHWDEVIRIIAEVEKIGGDYKTLSKSKRRELVNKYPLFVSWYCAVRLELTLKTLVVPPSAPAITWRCSSGPPREAWCTFTTSCGSMARRASTSVPSSSFRKRDGCAKQDSWPRRRCRP